MKHKWISCLDLGLISKIFHLHIQISPTLKNPKSEMFLVPSISDKWYSTCITIKSPHSTKTIVGVTSFLYCTLLDVFISQKRKGFELRQAWTRKLHVKVGGIGEQSVSNLVYN
jgi:hypothetical protein